MKSRIWLAVTVLTLLLTGFILSHAKAPTGTHTHRPLNARNMEVRGPGKVSRDLSGAAAWRIRNGKPSHWRACLLQPEPCLFSQSSIPVIP